MTDQVLTLAQWQASEVAEMSVAYAGLGMTKGDYLACRTKIDYWLNYLLPWLEAGKPISLPVCRWLAGERRLLWVQKNFPEQCPHVFSDSGHVI